MVALINANASDILTPFSEKNAYFTPSCLIFPDGITTFIVTLYFRLDTKLIIPIRFNEIYYNSSSQNFNGKRDSS